MTVLDRFFWYLPPKKVTYTTCEKMHFPRFQNRDISTPKCGLKLNLVSFTVDSLPSFNAVVIPCIWSSHTYLLFHQKPEWKKYILLTILLSSLPTYFMFSVTVTHQYSPIRSDGACPPVYCLRLLPNSGLWVKPGIKQHICQKHCKYLTDFRLKIYFLYRYRILFPLGISRT